MAYHQAHLLMLAGYSSFFVSGLVLPKAEYSMSHLHVDQHDDVTMADDDMDVDPSVVPQELNEAGPSAPCSQAARLPSAVNVEKRRKRSLLADQSHVRTISRWLCETQSATPRQPADHRPRQNSMPDMSASLRDLHDTKRFCRGPRPRLPSIQTTGLKVLAA